MFVLLLIVCLATSAYASIWNIDCYDCLYDSHGLDHLPHPCCANFYQCQRIDYSVFVKHTMCCPKDTYWNTVTETCEPGDPNNGCDMTCSVACNLPPIVMEPCHLKENPKDSTTFFNDGVLMDCAPGTYFDIDNCTCIHGVHHNCDPDELVFFEFTDGDDEWIDSSCNKIPCFPYGGAFVQGGAMHVDGIDGYCAFDFLMNWFSENPESQHFSIFVDIKQTNAGWNKAFEGIFANGDCEFLSTIMLGTSFNVDHFVVGELLATGGAVFPSPAQYPDDTWVSIGMVYSNGMVKFYYQCAEVAEMPAHGNILNTQVSSTIGKGFDLSPANCACEFFSGEIDNLHIWKTSLPPARISTLCPRQ